MNATAQQLTLEQALQQVFSHHAAGRVAQAETICLQVLQALPKQPEALHALGLIAHQTGRGGYALECLSLAVQNRPSQPLFHLNLGIVAAALGRFDLAESAYRTALALDANLPNLHEAMGNLLRAEGKLEEAENHFRIAVANNPASAESHYNLAFTRQELGRIDAAEQGYREATALRPDFAEAHNNLGNLLLANSRLDEAINCFKAALVARPDLVQAHNNLGRALAAKGLSGESIKCYQTALTIEPHFVEALFNLASAQDAAGNADEAIGAYRRVLALKPDYPEVHNNLGVALADSGQHREAIAHYQIALQQNPLYAKAHNNLGNAYHDLGDIESAIAAYSAALKLDTEFPEACNNLGRAYAAVGKFAAAIASYRKAIELKPDDALAQNNLGNALRETGKLEEAASHFKAALETRPDFPGAHSNLGNALREQGRVGEAIACYRRALELDPEFLSAYDNLLFALQYDAGCSARELYEEHLRFGERFGKPVEALRQRHGNSREGGRRLKLGYVSADYRKHSVAYFIEPVLAHHDKTQVEVYCYYNHVYRDEVTQRLSGWADHWVGCFGMNDDELARRIREDGIDILIDLAGHTAGNRLLTFARKPAPVQVSWLGYPCTTGLQAIDYRITDKYAEPQGMTEALNVEQLWRVDGMFCVYRSCAAKPERRTSRELAVQATPALANGHITFGSINNIAKLTLPVVALWAKILEAVPGSKLLLEAAGFDGGDMRADFEARFAAHGIGRERLMLLERKPEQQYVLYHRIDIALDPFPCNGGTTTCDALWMGVPVVTLAGNSFASRMGVTMASNAGHPDWVTQDADEYVKKACALASDVQRLDAVRQTLRAEVERSPLMDEAGFTRNLESAYRGMWQKWCAS